MDIKAIIAISTAIALGVLNLVIQVNKMMMNKKNRGNSKNLPCKIHEAEIKNNDEQIKLLFNKTEEQENEFEKFLLVYTKEMATLSTNFNNLLEENEKEHGQILQAIEKLSERR